MLFRSHTLPVLVSLMAGVGASAALRATTVTINIQNQSDKPWTLKHGKVADINVSLREVGSTGEVAGKAGSLPNTAYYDLLSKKKYTLTLVGAKDTTKVDLLFQVGGENKIYRVLHAFWLETLWAATDADMSRVGPYDSKPYDSPGIKMVPIVGEDTMVKLTGTNVVITGNKYPSR